MLLSGDLTAGDKVDIDAHDGQLRLTVHPRDVVPEQRQGAGATDGDRAAAGSAGEGVPSDPGDEGGHRL